MPQDRQRPMPKCLQGLYLLTWPSQPCMTARLSLQRVLGSLLQLQGQEQTAGFATGHVTTGAHVFCWAQPQPSRAVEAVPSNLRGVPMGPPALHRQPECWGYRHAPKTCCMGALAYLPACQRLHGRRLLFHGVHQPQMKRSDTIHKIYPPSS